MNSIDDSIGPARAGWRGDVSVDAALRDAWIRDGLVVFPGVVPAEQIDKHVGLVAAIRKEVPNGTDEHGLGDRIGQLHQRLPELIDTVASARLLSFIKWALDDDPLLFGSLNFDRGTQQEAHVDLIHFCTEPLYAMVGVWIALEDIHVDAGPLFYHVGSHHWPFEYPGDAAASEPPSEGEELSRRGDAWVMSLAGRIADNGSKPLAMPIRKGDAVIWHAKLAHGGMPRNRPELSRRSVVYHFIGAGSRLYTFQEFFSYKKDALLIRRGVEVPWDKRGIVTFQKHGYFVTYHDGEQIIHRL